MHLRAGGLDHHVQVLGAGPPVVLLHGLLVGSMATWYFTAAPALARQHRVILPDLRGHGLSGHAQTGYGLATLTDDLEAVLRALAVEGPVDLVGHSYGGLVALTWALRHPERTRRLVIVDAPLPPSGGVVIGEASSPEALVALLPAQARAALAGGGRRARRFLDGLTRLLSSSLPDDVAAEPALDPGALAALPTPTLLVYGDASRCLADGEVLARLLPRARLERVAGGHYLPLEAAHQLTPLLEAWIDA